MGIHFVPACCIINNKGERTLFHCVLLCVGHETRDKVSYLLDVLSGITVPNNIITFFSKKFFFSNFLQFLQPRKKWKFWEKKNLSKLLCIFWTYWIMYHCILPCKFNHLWSSPSGPKWPYSTGRFLSGPFTIYETGSRSYPRLRSWISSKMWRFVP